MRVPIQRSSVGARWPYRSGYGRLVRSHVARWLSADGAGRLRNGRYVGRAGTRGPGSVQSMSTSPIHTRICSSLFGLLVASMPLASRCPARFAAWQHFGSEGSQLSRARARSSTSVRSTPHLDSRSRSSWACRRSSRPTGASTFPGAAGACAGRERTAPTCAFVGAVLPHSIQEGKRSPNAVAWGHGVGALGC